MKLGNTMTNAVECVGRVGTQFFFSKDGMGVVVDELSNTVVAVNTLSAITASLTWKRTVKKPAKSTLELANAALTELDITVLSANDRMYTVPRSVTSEARRGVKWLEEMARGGSQVGLSTARTLVAGGQINIDQVRHIADYFPRHEVDKKSTGYTPSDEGYPSNGRISSALRGGEAAQRWASGIVDTITAAMHGEYPDAERTDVESFSHEENLTEFFIRISLNKGAIDRLYRIETDGKCQVWDDGYWDDMGNIDHDFDTFDKVLDDPYDRSEKIYVPIDTETAITISAMFDGAPFKSVTLKEVNFDETDMFEHAIPEMDWDTYDRFSTEVIPELADYQAGYAIRAAGEDDTPGVYTDEERSENAATQVRDKFGRFTQTGSTVIIGGDANYSGVVTAQNPEAGSVSVQLADGNTVEVPGSTVQESSTFEPVSQVPASNLDFSGILGEPRTPIDQPQANLPGRLPALNANDLGQLVTDWGTWASDQRLAPEYEPGPAPAFVPKAVPDFNTAMGRYYQGAFNPDGSARAGWNPATAPNVANDPLLRDWLDNTLGGSSGSYQSGWYNPVVPTDAKKSRGEVYSKKNEDEIGKKYNIYASGVIAAATGTTELTPETSDVAPIYLAIVAPDDPQAVMTLLSLVPANAKSTTPSTYRRDPGEWVKDDKLMADLNSPTPPPVVVLDNMALSSVVEQIDGEEVTPVSASAALSNNFLLRSIMAAGGADRNKGNAETLRRYWTVGKGGLKIRWGTGGDWTRCNRYLKKYMGPRAKGYCALRHKEMTGMWPGDKRNAGKKKSVRASAEPQMVSPEIETLKTTETIISEFTLRARAHSAKSRLVGRSGPSPDITQRGAPFVIPLIIPEGVETGDGRIFYKDSIDLRSLPLPLLWQIKTGPGHDGSVVVGQIVHMERVAAGIGNGYGYFDTGDYGREAERLVRYGFLRGVSADMDKFEEDEAEVPEIDAELSKSDETEDEKSDKIYIRQARVMAVTIVPKPAFQECYIQVVEETDGTQEEAMQADGIYVDGVNPLDASALVACGVVAGAIPMEPPKAWFANPKLNRPTPLTIDDEGRVFGHIASWGVDHIGMTAGTRPPRSRSQYAYFHTGSLQTMEGSSVPVGQLTLAGGHAGMDADAAQAVRHYDDTASAFADVFAGEDAYGIWVAGALRPGTGPEQIRAARASAPSGDWRPIKGRLELVAVCQVNVPGFPIARARVASGQIMALVAAGASTLAQLKYDPLAELTAKVTSLETARYTPGADEAKSRFSAMRQEVLAVRAAELSDRVKEAKKSKEGEEDGDWEYMIQMMDGDPEDELAVVSRRVRERLAREGKALPDGSFPIRNANDLRNAVKAYDKAKSGAKGAVRKHIMVRAKDLRKEDLLPPRWSTAFSADGEEISLRDRALTAASTFEAPVSDIVTDFRKKAELALNSLNSKALFSEQSLTAAAEDDVLNDLSREEIEALKQEKQAQDNENKDDGIIKFTPDTQPRDDSGKFRKVLARLKQDLGEVGLQRVVEKVQEAESLDNAGDYTAASQAADDLIGIIDRLDTKALNPDSLENIRESSAELGKVIANLPFDFGADASKIRFSDIPPALRSLMEDMIDKVEQKIGMKDANEATADLKRFMSGADYYNQSEISSQMSKLLRLLT